MLYTSFRPAAHYNLNSCFPLPITPAINSYINLLYVFKITFAENNSRDRNLSKLRCFLLTIRNSCTLKSFETDGDGWYRKSHTSLVVEWKSPIAIHYIDHRPNQCIYALLQTLHAYIYNTYFSYAASILPAEIYLNFEIYK